MPPRLDRLLATLLVLAAVALAVANLDPVPDARMPAKVKEFRGQWPDGGEWVPCCEGL